MIPDLLTEYTNIKPLRWDSQKEAEDYAKCLQEHHGEALFAADGHVGMIKAGYRDPYYPYSDTGYIWVTGNGTLKKMTPKILLLGLHISLSLPMFASANLCMEKYSNHNVCEATYAFMYSDVGCSALYNGKKEHLSIEITNQEPSIYAAIKEMIAIHFNKKDVCPDQIIIGISPGSMERDAEFSSELSSVLLANDEDYGFSHQKYVNRTWKGIRVLNKYNRGQIKDAVLKMKTITKISEVMFQHGFMVNEVKIGKIIMEKPSCKIFSLLSVSYKKKN